MKIAVDARTLGDCPSGIGIYLYDFIKALLADSENTGSKLEILLLTDIEESEQLQKLKEAGLKIQVFGKKVFRSAGVYAYFLFIRRILLAEQPELFWEPNNLIPIKLKGFTGKIVVTVHDLFPITKPEYFRWVYRIYFKQGIRKSIRQADAFLFDSEETRQLAQKYFQQIKKKRSLVSHLIVPRPPIRAVVDDGFFLYIGNLELRKGTDLLLAAYRIYRNAGGKRPLYLGGKIRDPEVQVLLERSLEDFPEIRYLGYLNEAEKYDFLSRCHCFLFPSKAEGFGIPPLEAMGYEKPLILSDLSIFQEIFTGDSLALPVATFQLSDPPDMQAQKLGSLMLQDTYPVCQTGDCEKLWKRYEGQVLGKQLADFFRSLADETNKGSL